jgi:hypothetical protein
VGTLTLLFAAGSADREVLLEMLQEALGGGLLRALEENEFGEDDSDVQQAHEDDFEAEGLDIPPWTRGKGGQLLYVIHSLKRWLRDRPAGPLELGPRAGHAIAPLVCSWSGTVTHALASEPLSLAALDRAVPILSCETVEEHLVAMAHAGQVEALTGDGETRYALTDWMRRGLAPIAAAARLELHHPEPDVAPPEALDVDAGFQLLLPLLRLPEDLRGACRLDVRFPGGGDFAVGAMAEFEGGRIVSSSPLLEERPHTLITGTPIQWLDTLAHPSSLQVGVSGDLDLVDRLLVGMHRTLFGDVAD